MSRLSLTVYRVYCGQYWINSSAKFRSIGRLPKPNCEDLSANFRIRALPKRRKIFQRGAVPNTEDATMKSLTTKLVLSALGFALLSGPALAQYRANQYPADQYPTDQWTVVVRGQI